MQKCVESMDIKVVSLSESKIWTTEELAKYRSATITKVKVQRKMLLADIECHYIKDSDEKKNDEAIGKDKGTTQMWVTVELPYRRQWKIADD